jgi:hypothetical protein
MMLDTASKDVERRAAAPGVQSVEAEPHAGQSELNV